MSTEELARYLEEKVPQDRKVFVNLKELTKKQERGDLRYTGGHKLCPGCGQGTLIRNVLLATNDPVVVSNNTGCVYVSGSEIPYSSWTLPYINTTLAGAPSAMSGIYAAWRYRMRTEPGSVDPNTKFMVYGGDGGFYDIGLSNLSGMFHLNDPIFVVCGNNQAYMNTGIQESGSTFGGVATTTTPAGEVPGCLEDSKTLPMILEGQRVPYIAQTGTHNFTDIIKKAKKGFETQGPAYLEAYAPCPLGWGHPSSYQLDTSRLAAETCLYPMYEVIEGELQLTGESLQIYEGTLRKKPLEEMYRHEVRFRHLLKDGEGRSLLELQQEAVDKKWEKLMIRHRLRV